MRLDSTTARRDGSLTEEGVFQFGHSQDHRPDLPQVKVMLAALDPRGMPLAATEALLSRYRVAGLVQVRYEKVVKKRAVRR